MTDKEQQQWLRAILLRLVELHESLMTTSPSLAASGVVTPEAFQSAKAQALEHWKEARETIEKLETQDDPSLAEILKNFEGPIQ